jgi:RNA polymerase sporulation-specific sigma factor
MKYKDYNDYQLISLVAESNEEAERIVYEKYKPLVIQMAKKYIPYFKNKGVEIADLIQEGYIGLSEAVRNYKDNKDAKFSTFAVLCIDRQLKSYLTTANRQKHHYLNNAISFYEKNDLPLVELLASDKSDPIHYIVVKENMKNILSALYDKFTDLEKQVFELKKSNFSNVEISEVLEITYKQVDNATQRIKQKVKNAIKQEID